MKIERVVTIDVVGYLQDSEAFAPKVAAALREHADQIEALEAQPLGEGGIDVIGSQRASNGLLVHWKARPVRGVPPHA